MGTYFVTGATGFLGRRLVERLLARPDCDHVFALVRPQSADRVAKHDKLTVVPGDLTAPLDFAQPVDHVVHLGAVYDLTAPDDVQRRTNVDGTRHVLDLARTLRATLHHVSSIAVAGDYRGTFHEDDFDLGQQHPSPYHRTKFEAEKLVRADKTTPWRVYRPAAVVGDSTTGEIDKVDGPYYFFPAIAALAHLPTRLPLVAPHFGATNIVPVDYVVKALDHLIHADVPDHSTFHLTADNVSLTDVYNALAAPAGAPKVRAAWPSLPLPAAPTSAILTGTLTELGIPPQVLPHLALHATFDSTTTRTVTGLEPPPLHTYADVLWRYWQDHLDPLRAARKHGLAGRTVLITGASSGIGRATALAVARKRATVLLVARRAEELDQVAEEIRQGGGTAHTYPCDLTDAEAVEALLKRVLADHDGIDMLVNNAGRSIRRSVHLSVDRLHDYERTMALNYFAPLRLILGLLPHMRERRFGHVVNISSMGVQIGTPRFSAYLASKSALDAFSRVAASETVADGVTFTSVRMPLVRTPMIGPSKVYDAFPAATPERAAQWVLRALERRPEEVNLPLGVLVELARKVAPKTMRSLVHLGYRAMPERSERTSPLAAVAAGVTRLTLRALR
ncbi:SDR family oxidoreductase [Saccharothrix variisporea]|uniref:Short-subunit dehydrogenase n=1 Tax=Saccharothrix variisporea TaxID=543527 RepID=A0A495X9J3_9PSEU|nr:SDR family oxidoreductase [Saccharothrix variisporea]RKT70289.1 short-subunit dehydrogenase [Saccharothrix variisporea]